MFENACQGTLPFSHFMQQVLQIYKLLLNDLAKLKFDFCELNSFSS